MKDWIMSDQKREEELKSLLDAITQERGRPIDVWEITALLEIYGLRDIDAKNDWGYDSLFDMAKDMEPFIDTKTYEEKHYGIIELEETNTLKRVLKNYFKGLAFSVPMILQILMMLTVGYAIWSSLRYDVHLATLITLGTFIALIVTGSISQAIGRKGLYYLKLNEFALASKISMHIYIIGFIIVIAVALLLIFIQFFFYMMLQEDFLIVLSFYILLSILFLGNAVYYMFEEYLSVTIYFILAMALVYIFFSFFQLNVMMSQLYALAITDIIITFMTIKKLRDLRKKSDLAEGEALPKTSVLAHSLMPFFTYGLLYFLLLLIDRVIAWSVYYEGKPYFIWFIVPYEVGLDWALIALIALIGITEVSIYEYMYRSQILTYKYHCNEYKKFNEDVYSFFKRFNRLFFIVSLIVIVCVYFAIYFLDQYINSTMSHIFFQPPTPFIYWVAAFSYVLIVNTLMNVLLLFSLSRFLAPVRYAFYAVMTDIVVGLILSRMLGYEYAVFGLLAGSLVFFIGTARYTRHVTKNFDFYYYSAY
jgi:MFS family permease